jgi:hypothetical protein
LQKERKIDVVACTELGTIVEHGHAVAGRVCIRLDHGAHNLHDSEFDWNIGNLGGKVRVPTLSKHIP